MDSPENKVWVELRPHCERCGREAYWHNGAWRHVHEPDAIFCAILGAAIEIGAIG